MIQFNCSGFLIFLMLLSCRENNIQISRNEDGILLSKPFEWNTSISISGQKILTIINGAKYKDLVVVGFGNEDKQGIAGLESETGDILWQWYDNVGTYKININDQYTDMNKMIWRNGRELYGLDIEKGITLIKKRYELNPNVEYLSGIGDNFYVIGEKEEELYEGSTSTRLFKSSIDEKGILTQIAKPSYSGVLDFDNNFSIGGPVSAFIRNGDSLVLFNTIESQATADGFNSYIHLYNINTSSWVYEHKLISDQARSIIQKRPGVWNDLAYYVMSDWVICTDLMTGEIVWTHEYLERTHFVFGGYYIASNEGLLLVNAEGAGTTLYAFDLISGNIKWKEPSSGTSSEMAYLNGVVYFVGGGDGYLHAVEVESGVHLWKLRAPHDDEGDYFSPVCITFPGANNSKGRVVVTSWLNAYGYEAER